MPEPDFSRLAGRLQKAGIQPRIVQRAVGELRDHYDDLVAAATRSGATEAEAGEIAARQLGDPETIASAMAAQPGLKTWAFRHPRLAMLVYPIAWIVLLPAVPVVAGVNHASAVARWGTSLLAAGLFTAGLLLVLQLSILFG